MPLDLLYVRQSCHQILPTCQCMARTHAQSAAIFLHGRQNHWVALWRRDVELVVEGGLPWQSVIRGCPTMVDTNGCMVRVSRHQHCAVRPAAVCACCRCSLSCWVSLLCGDGRCMATRSNCTEPAPCTTAQSPRTPLGCHQPRMLGTHAQVAVSIASTLGLEATARYDASFIQVNQSTNSSLFYWYTPATEPINGGAVAPTVVWLNGTDTDTALVACALPRLQWQGGHRLSLFAV